jgi:hypothetical protein
MRLEHPTAVRRTVLAVGLLAVAGGASGLLDHQRDGAAPAPAPNPDGPTYYVSSRGSDTASGTSTSKPWRTIAKVNATRLKPGDRVLFARGQTFAGRTLTLEASGTKAKPITIGAYGTGPRPIFDGGGTDAPKAGTHQPIQVNGNWVVLESIQCQHSSLAGIDVHGTDCRVVQCTLTHNAFGVMQEASAARLTVTYCRLIRNTFEIIVPGANNDYGSNGIGLGGAGAEISYNYSEGNVGLSPDYGTDGSFCEIFNATDANVHHNISMNDLAFTECGNSTRTTGNTFHHNIMWSAVVNAGGLNVHGTGDFGGVTDTKWINNTVYLTNAKSVGFFVTGPTSCVVHNNIFVSGYCGNSGSPIDEAGNVYDSLTPNGVLSANSPTGRTIARSSVSTRKPGLVRPALNGDFQLVAGSPAINRGVPTPYRYDFAGKPRHGSAWDAGAFEYQG